MAQQTFTLWTGQTFTPNVEPGTHDLVTSSNISNNNNLPSARIVVEYTAVTPDDSVNVEKTFGVTAILEALGGNGQWFPVAYQFEPFRSLQNGSKRVIVLQPDISDFNAGIDDIVYVADATVARISRQQGKCGGTMRVRLVLRENGTGAGALQSLTVTAYGELYDGA